MPSLIAEIDELHQKNTTLEASCQQLEKELESSRMGRKGELALELEMKRRQQAELEKHLHNLEKQRKRLSVTRNEVCVCVSFAVVVLIRNTTLSLHHLLPERQINGGCG